MVRHENGEGEMESNDMHNVNTFLDNLEPCVYVHTHEDVRMCADKNVRGQNPRATAECVYVHRLYLAHDLLRQAKRLQKSNEQSHVASLSVQGRGWDGWRSASVRRRATARLTERGSPVVGADASSR